MRLQSKSNSIWPCFLLSVAIASIAVGCKSPSRPPDQFSVHKQTRYFDFRFERNSPQIEGVARFADGYIDVINRDFFKADFDYPIRVVMLQDRKHFQEFVRRDLQVPDPPTFGMYFYSPKLLATYEDSGLGTFAHETLHAFVDKDLKYRPAWADEGIPTFFEKFYGYWKNDDLVLLWGFQNPWRIEELGTNLTQLSLPEIISDQNPERDESKLRMVSVFLWQQGRFRRFLKLIAANDKHGYPSYFEAAMELPLEGIIPLWQNYLLDVERRRSEILYLPSSAVFDSEEAFQSFAKVHSISTEQVVQRD
jgi:hypothetical protein